MRPPAAILLAAAYGAGLATGLAHFRAPGCVALVLGCLLARRPAGWLLLATALGTATGLAARGRAEASCAARLPEAPVALLVALREPAPVEGGLVAVHPLGAACAGDVLARWPARLELPAGALARVEGRWLPRRGALGRPEGMLVVVRAAAAGGEPGLAEGLRTWIARTSERLYGSRAPLVEALVNGRRGGLDPALRDDFAASGLVHLLSISGFHVGLIVAWVVLGLRAAGVRREPALLWAGVLATAYVGFLGWPAPAVRAAWLAWLLALLRLRQRAAQPDALLGVSALGVLLLDPWAVADLGAWLSVLSLWGATRFARWTDAEVGRGKLLEMGAGSVGATLAGAPLTAAVLGTVAPVGIILNFAAIPVAAVAVPGVLASLLLAPLAAPVAGALAAGSGLALHLLELLARAGGRLPLGHLTVPPGPPQAVPWLALLVAACWATGRHVTARVAGWRSLGIVTAVLWVALGREAAADGLLAGRDGAPGELALHLLDVGQGDAAVIRTPGGHVVLVDAGPAGPDGDAGRRVVVPWLRRAGIRSVDVLVASHGHLDHVGGAGAVLDRVRVGLVLEPGAPVPDAAYGAFLEAVAGAGVPWRPARPGERFTIDSVAFTVLRPDPAWPRWGEDVNDDSVILLVEYRGFRALFPGDAGFAAESALAGRVGPVDLLKVGHHGSRTSSGDGWLAELAPQVAVVPVGRNTYGHPAPEALARLAAHGAEIWRTDRDGTVTVRTDGRTVRVEGRARRRILDARAAASATP